MSPEFDLITKHFTRPIKNATLGIGDDCALIGVSPGCELAISTDTLVSGTHFFADTDAEKLGHKALAVNLSDLAAMGATPRYVTLALTLPSIDDRWLAAFARGFFALANKHGVELIGGDTTRGPLSITLTVLGEVDTGKVLRRDGAREGDDIWVSGNLGGAALALKHMQGKANLPTDVFEFAAAKLHTPNPRVALGRTLVGVATSAIDISDGLIADLSHLCERSRLSAQIVMNDIPIFAPLESLDVGLRHACALSGGDDYELCFTAPDKMRDKLSRISAETGLTLTCIGSMRGGDPQVQVQNENGELMKIPQAGFDHFANHV